MWDESRNDGYAIKISDENEKIRAKWITRLARLTTLYAQQQRQQQQQVEPNNLNIQQRRHSSYYGNGAMLSNTAQQQWLYQQQQQQQLLQQKQQQQHQRPQSWASDGSCSMSSRSSMSVPEDGTAASEE